MNDYEKIISKLEEHREHANKFREELKVGLSAVAIRIEELSQHQKTANGRTGKLEETVNGLRIEDALMNEKLKTIKTGSNVTSDRMWMLIVGVGIAVIVTIFNKFLIK